jgi:hypothetical protein
MKKLLFTFLSILLLSGTVMAAGGLDAFLNDLNVQAHADMNGFSAKVSAQFGVPLPKVQAVIKTVDSPSDAFMCFQLGEMSRKPYDTVVNVYRADKGKGWGVIAKNLGIKPGSREFHALKRGDFALTGAPGGEAGPRKDKGKGKGRNK